MKFPAFALFPCPFSAIEPAAQENYARAALLYPTPHHRASPHRRLPESERSRPFSSTKLTIEIFLLRETLPSRTREELNRWLRQIRAPVRCGLWHAAGNFSRVVPAGRNATHCSRCDCPHQEIPVCWS
jgi:hypothetical protein